MKMLKKAILSVSVFFMFITFSFKFSKNIYVLNASNNLKENEVGTGNIDMTTYYERIKALGNVFSSEVKCEADDCSDRPEVRYYLKVADIALRYKNKYHVNLDWVLLNATMMFSDSDEEATMKRALNDYDLDAVEDYDKLMNLDWDYDYKNIPGYTYLSPDDFRYDLQILAKNMVTKTTTQTCSKKVKDADGNVVVEITKTKTDIDIEDKYLNPDGKYYLECEDGETHSISSVYRYDAEKYDEFLLEYIERKYYMPSNGSNTNVGNYTGYTCVSQEFIKYDLTDDQLAQIASLAYHEQGTAKGAAAEASLMANLFEIKGSNYGEGADGLYNYVRTSGWFANAAKNMDSYDASPEIIAAVKSVLVDGKRTLPGYIDEHDWINDLKSVTNDGESIDKKDRSQYVQFKTEIKNIYGATYTFYSFPDTNSDPFGYTSEERRKKIGEFHYDYDTGEAVSCSSAGTDLSSAFVNLALSQQGVSGRPNAYTEWYGKIDGSYSYPWCATFVSWAIEHTEFEGQKLSDIIDYSTASVNYFADYFIKTPNLQYVESAYYGGNYIPKEGDLIFFAWKDDYGNCTYDGLWSMDHIGIVVEAKDGRVYTIEGNTSDSVATRSYSLDSCEVSSYGVWY